MARSTPPPASRSRIGAEQALRQLLRAVHRDLLRPVRQRRVAEAREERRAVAREVDARRHARAWARSPRPSAARRARPSSGSRGRLRRSYSWPGEEAEVRERRVAAVEQPQLHRLERRDVGDELRAGLFPRAGAARRSGPRSPTGRTARRRPAPRRARRAARSTSAMSASVVAGHDAVDHRARETRRARDPVARAPDRARCANAARGPRRTRPLCGRLSQQTTLSAPAPGARGARRARRRAAPTADTGASGCARSWTMSGCARSSAPVAGSWQ